MTEMLAAGWSHPDEILRIEHDTLSGPGDPIAYQERKGPRDRDEATPEDFLAADPPDALLRLLSEERAPEETLRCFQRLLQAAPRHEMFLMGELLVHELSCRHPDRAALSEEIERILENQLAEKLLAEVGKADGQTAS